MICLFLQNLIGSLWNHLFHFRVRVLFWSCSVTECCSINLSTCVESTGSFNKISSSLNDGLLLSLITCYFAHVIVSSRSSAACYCFRFSFIRCFPGSCSSKQKLSFAESSAVFAAVSISITVEVLLDAQDERREQ